MFFGAKAELFTLALQMERIQLKLRKQCGKYSESSANRDFHFADSIQLNFTLLTFIVII